MDQITSAILAILSDESGKSPEEITGACRLSEDLDIQSDIEIKCTQASLEEELGVELRQGFTSDTTVAEIINMFEAANGVAA